jgi:hypothetical protein
VVRNAQHSALKELPKYQQMIELDIVSEYKVDYFEEKLIEQIKIWQKGDIHPSYAYGLYRYLINICSSVNENFQELDLENIINIISINTANNLLFGDFTIQNVIDSSDFVCNKLDRPRERKFMKRYVKRVKQKFLGHDKYGQLVFLADSDFSIQMTQQKYPTVELFFTSDYQKR